jgi:hypothetical protein
MKMVAIYFLFLANEREEEFLQKIARRRLLCLRNSKKDLEKDYEKDK